MAVVVFDNVLGGGDGLWSTNTNWVGNALPGPADTADIDADCILDQDDIVAQLDIAAGITLTMGSGGNPFDITGMTGSCLGTGTISMEAGSELTWNSAGDFGTGDCDIVARGTSGSRCLIDNVGAGAFDVPSQDGDIDAEWTDIHSVNGYFSGSALFRLVNCDLEGIGGASYCVPRAARIIVKDCFISNFGHATWGGLTFSEAWNTTVQNQVENTVFGEDRDANSQANTVDIGLYGNVASVTLHINMRSVRLLGATPIYWHANLVQPASRVIVDNYGFDGTTGTLGIGFVDSDYWTYERSTAAKKTGDFGARVTPKTGIDTAEDYYAEIPVYIPIVTGDNISVSVYAWRDDGGSGGMTNDCVEVELDPEGAWFTPDTSSETLTSADTWYELTASGAGANAGEGAVRIILRLKEFAAADTAFFADMTVMVGSTTYTIDFGEWSKGSPLAVASGGGGGLLTMLGGKIG